MKFPPTGPPPETRSLVSGYIGDHGMAIMSQRENLEFEGAIESDCAPLHGLVAAMLQTGPAEHHSLPARSYPWRGGHHAQ